MTHIGPYISKMVEFINKATDFHKQTFVLYYLGALCVAYDTGKEIVVPSCYCTEVSKMLKEFCHKIPPIMNKTNSMEYPQSISIALVVFVIQRYITDKRALKVEKGKRKGTVHCSAEGNGGSVYRWGLPLRAQLLIYTGSDPARAQGWGHVQTLRVLTLSGHREPPYGP